MNLRLLEILNLTYDSSLLVPMMSVCLLAVVLLWFYHRHRRNKERQRFLDEQQVARLAMMLKTGKNRVWFYHPSTRHYYMMSESGSIERRINPVEFAQLFDRDDFEQLRSLVFDISDGHQETAQVLLRSNADSAEECQYYDVSISVASRDSHGHPTALLGVQHDVTELHQRQQKIDELLVRYHTVFNSSLLDMIAYDKEGRMTDINDRASSTFNITDREHINRDEYNIQGNLMYTKAPLDQLENTRSCSIIDFDHLAEDDYQRNKIVNMKGRMYYESAINPIRNSDGELEGVFMSGRNISEMVESFHRQQDGNRRLQQALKSNEEYVANINYALQVSDVRLVNYDPKSYTLEISNNVNQSQMRFSQLRCIRLATPPFRRTVSSVLNRMDHLTKSPIDQTIALEIRDKKGRNIWAYINMVPMLDAQGRVNHYFGMFRNITDQVETEERLAVESRKAQETELLKQAFLTNMSNEIRIPLNGVIDYASRFIAAHDVAEEPFFAEQIKNNTQTLLKLSNDTLYLSRLDANMEEYEKSDIDFEKVFESHCQMGATPLNPQVKLIVEHPYNSLVVDIDEEHVGRVIRRLCKMSSIKTEKGTITARYSYYRGELIITIEDTGGGVSDEVMPHFFERFSHDSKGQMCGTGLDLPIVQLMVQQMGGNIESQSELGKGTTIVISIPCTAKVMEKKRDTMA